MLFVDEPLKRTVDEFFPLADVIENLGFEDEKATVNANAAIVDGADSGHEIAVTLLNGDHVIAERRPNGEETCDLVVFVKMVELFRKIEVRKAIAVIREEFFLTIKILFDSLQSLANVAFDAGIGERDAPILDVAIVKFEIFSASREDEVVGDAFVVVEEIIFDRVGAITKRRMPRPPQNKTTFMMFLLLEREKRSR